jgi:hypothetical protein
VVILIQTIFLLGVYARSLSPPMAGRDASTNLTFLIYRAARR